MPPKREERTRSKLRFEAEKDAAGTFTGLPVTFALILTTCLEYKFRREWQEEFGSAQRVVVKTGISRRELEELLADGIGWLAYQGEEAEG
jgi:hypothetical protein